MIEIYVHKRIGLKKLTDDDRLRLWGACRCELAPGSGEERNKFKLRIRGRHTKQKIFWVVSILGQTAVQSIAQAALVKADFEKWLLVDCIAGDTNIVRPTLSYYRL